MGALPLDAASCLNLVVWCRLRIAIGARDVALCVMGVVLRHCWAARVAVRDEMDRGIDLEQVWKALRMTSDRRRYHVELLVVKE